MKNPMISKQLPEQQVREMVYRVVGHRQLEVLGVSSNSKREKELHQLLRHMIIVLLIQLVLLEIQLLGQLHLSQANTNETGYTEEAIATDGRKLFWHWTADAEL